MFMNRLINKIYRTRKGTVQYRTCASKYFENVEFFSLRSQYIARSKDFFLHKLSREIDVFQRLKKTILGRCYDATGVVSSLEREHNLVCTHKESRNEHPDHQSSTNRYIFDKLISCTVAYCTIPVTFTKLITTQTTNEKKSTIKPNKTLHPPL